MLDKAGLGQTGDVLTGANIIVGSENTFGKTGKISPLEIKYIVENHESTGLIEAPYMTIPVHDMSQHYVQHFSEGKDILIKGNIRRNGTDVPVTIALDFQLHEIKPIMEEGKEAGREFKVRVDTYIEKVDGKETVKWNRESITLVLGGNGKNLLEDFKNNVLG